MARGRLGALGGLSLMLLGPPLFGAPAPLRTQSPARFRNWVIEELRLPPPFDVKAPPRFTEAEVARFSGEPAPRFLAALRQAQLAVWATSMTEPPAALAAEVRTFQSRWRLNAGNLRRTYLAPAGGAAGRARFQEQLLADNKAMARMIWRLNAVLDELKEVERMRAAQPLRWRANYDLIRGALQAHLVMLEHHQLALGLMRKDPPPINLAVSAGWHLVPANARVPDREVRELARGAAADFDRVKSEQPKTYWAEVAEQARQVKLGLEWRPLPAPAQN